MRYDQDTGRLISSDGNAGGSLEIGEGYVSIYEWWSYKLGSGVRLLEELRSRYRGRVFVAHNIGSDPSNESWRYWMKAAVCGLIDEATDDSGQYVVLPPRSPRAIAVLKGRY